jgi:F-box/WD-40 domain protein 12/13/14/15/16/17/19
MWSVPVPGCRDLLFIDSPGQFSLQVVYMNSLLRTSEFSAPVSTILKFSLCDKAFWTPRREDRITQMSRGVPPRPTKFATFDMKLEEIGNKVTVQGKP